MLFGLFAFLSSSIWSSPLSHTSLSIPSSSSADTRGPPKTKNHSRRSAQRDISRPAVKEFPRWWCEADFKLLWQPNKRQCFVSSCACLISGRAVLTDVAADCPKHTKDKTASIACGRRKKLFNASQLSSFSFIHFTFSQPKNCKFTPTLFMNYSTIYDGVCLCLSFDSVNVRVQHPKNEGKLALLKGKTNQVEQREMCVYNWYPCK